MEFQYQYIGNKLDSFNEYDNVHHSMYSCISYFKSFYHQNDYHQLDYYDNSNWINRIYYYIENKTVEVMGALSNYSNNDIDLFSKWLFNKYPNYCISWGGFYQPYYSTEYKVYKTAIVSDVLTDLPKSEVEYLKSLNTTTRKHVLYYKRRLIKDFPEIKMNAYACEDISIELVRKIIYYNHLRMESKKVSSSLDDDFVNSIFQMCLEHGIIHTLELENQLIAATINIHVNKDSHLAVISHNPEYNKYNPGQIALYNTIIDSIANEDERFHFLWDMSDYKKRFGGQLVELYYYHIYEKISVRSIFDAIKCNLNCKLMYFQKRSPKGRRIIDFVKKILKR